MNAEWRLRAWLERIFALAAARVTAASEQSKAFAAFALLYFDKTAAERASLAALAPAGFPTQ